MPDWYRVKETETTTAQPTQWHMENGEKTFMVQYVRVSGPSDRKLPRRLVAMGPTRQRAFASARRVLRRYDPMYQLISRPQTRV